MNRENELNFIQAMYDGRDLDMRKMLQSGFDPTDGEDVDLAGGIVLITAVEIGHLDVVRALLEDGRADPSIDNNQALYLSCCQRKYEICFALLSDQRVRSELKNTPYLQQYDFLPKLNGDAKNICRIMQLIMDYSE